MADVGASPNCRSVATQPADVENTGFESDEHDQWKSSFHQCADGGLNSHRLYRYIVSVSLSTIRVLVTQSTSRTGLRIDLMQIIF